MPDFRKPSPTVMLVCASVILTLALGIRHGFGLFLQPMSMDNGWGREVFGFAVALQNLLWGITQPFTGMLADRFGARRVLFAGGLLYALGLVLMANSTTALGLTLAIGIFVGIGMSCTTFNIVFGALGRAYSAEKRSVVLGIASAAGSFGQFALLPLALVLITGLGWYSALIALSLLVAVVMPASFGVADKGYHGTLAAGAGVSLREALAEAFRHRGFWLLGVGYFACGFQVVFIGTHFPAFLMDQGLTARDGTICLSLIGLFNIFGSYLAGQLGHADVGLPLRRSDGLPLARHGAAHQRRRRRNFRREAPRHAVRFRVLLPSARQLLRRLARRLPLRSHRLVPARVADRDRPVGDFRGRESADRRAAGEAGGGGGCGLKNCARSSCCLELLSQKPN